MTTLLHDLEDRWEALPESLKGVQEGVWYVDRAHRPAPAGFHFDVRHGLFFDEGARTVISLAYGTSLHYHGLMDYELLAFKGTKEDDICCHSTLEEATDCALGAILTGRWCSNAES